MLDTVYVGLTGLDTYAKGLNVISNNVANLNTPGFKGTQLQFADLYYRNGDAGSGGGPGGLRFGSGVGTGGTFLNFQQGEGRQTGRDLDLMIDGGGLFILRKDGHTTYTRAGQFEFDREGFLVDQSTGARVAMYDDAGTIEDLSVMGLRANPPRATTELKLSGNLSSADTQHVISSATVYDGLGKAVALRLTFDNTGAATPGRWRVTVSADGTTVGTGEVRFRNGRPDLGFETFSLRFTPQGGEPMTVGFDFSTDVTSFSAGADSTLAVSSQDGYAAGSLIGTTFDAEGNFELSYSNGQKVMHGRLALAWFADPNALQQLGGNRFAAGDGASPRVGNPGGGEMGKIVSRSIEMSNVDLSQQFSEMIITQRGYQASSQVITTANEMMQQLLDLKGKR